jgi:hypothetical protein
MSFKLEGLHHSERKISNLQQYFVRFDWFARQNLWLRDVPDAKGEFGGIRKNEFQ